LNKILCLQMIQDLHQTVLSRVVAEVEMKGTVLHNKLAPFGWPDWEDAWHTCNRIPIDKGNQPLNEDDCEKDPHFVVGPTKFDSKNKMQMVKILRSQPKWWLSKLLVPFWRRINFSEQGLKGIRWAGYGRSTRWQTLSYLSSHGKST
jgi:hypothetical protein